MTYPRVILGLTGAAFLALGMVFLVSPDPLLSLFKLAPNSARAMIEVRAMYGGLEFGLGVFFVVAALRERWVRAALGAQFLILGAMAGSRLVGIVLSGRGDRLMTALVIVEGIGAALGLGAFGQAKRVLVNNRFERRRVE